MDLFCVNRYYGEDDAESKVDVAEAEKSRLLKLQERIRKRKKENSSKKKIEMGLLSAYSSLENVLSEKQRERKKFDVSNESVSLVENKDTEMNTQGHAQKEKHRKKKAKRGVKSENECEENVAIVNKEGCCHSGVEKEVAKTDEPVKKKRKMRESKVNKKNIADENMEKNDGVKNSRKNEKVKEITSIEHDERHPSIDETTENKHDEIISESLNDEVDAKEITSKTKTDTSVDHQATDSTYYTVLGTGGKKKQKQIVKRTLPKWIAEPQLIGADITRGKVAIDEADYLAESTKTNLKDNNIKFLFPVQSYVIPYILSQNSHQTIYGSAGLVPRDICVSAPTGSGKTLAYVLPLVQLLSGCVYRRLQAVIILPSKDLAAQVRTVIINHSKGTKLKVGLASGVKSFHEEQQQLISTGYGRFLIFL
eukprot:Seg1359.4 transcript_id=Seg1359.4/GoldUCD/mRNA.D3Y31 product="ATP-dependent RNA helicase DDX51" protein_id=Seg1359.4/GoldUCD/D3Y31